MSSQLTRVDSVVSTLSWKRRHIEKSASIPASPLIKPTLKRYIILFLFGVNSGNKAMQWIQIPASTAKITYFYGVENFVVNSLSVLFMLAFVLLSWPACYLIKKIGLRNSVLLGSFGTAVGAIIKCFSCYEQGIYPLFVGSIIVSLSEQFVFSVPSRLASVWFPDHQVSSAVAMCIFGNQLGGALGFLVPQFLLDSAETKEEIGQHLYIIFFGMAAISTVAFLADFILFDEAPKYAPGAARLRQIEQEESDNEKQLSFVEDMRNLATESKQLLMNRDYNILTMVYGIMVGANYALFTILNQMLEPLWPGDDILVGNAGFILIMAGLIGLPLWGRIMDRLHRYRLINILLSLGTILSFVLFAYVVSFMHSVYGIYIGAFLIGLFQTGLIASGLEFAVEITYPAAELVTSSFMNIQPQIFGAIFVYAASFIVDTYGALAANIFFIIVCSVALIMLPCIRETLKRQNAVVEKEAEKLDKRISSITANF